MASYTGNILSPTLSDNNRNVRISNPMGSHQVELTTEKFESGSKSLKVLAGGYQDIYVVCAAGSRTITCQVWPNSNTDKCGMLLYDPDNLGEILESDWSTSSGAWEELSISFTATAKMYILRLINGAPFTSQDAHCWFDTIEVE